MHDLQPKLIRGVSWSALQTLGSQAIQGVVFLLLARLLEPKDFGLLSLALVYVTFLQIFVNRASAMPSFNRTASRLIVLTLSVNTIQPSCQLMLEIQKR